MNKKSYKVVESGYRTVECNDGQVKKMKFKTTTETYAPRTVFKSFSDRVIKGGRPVGDPKGMTTLESRRLKKIKSKVVESRSPKAKITESLAIAKKNALRQAKRSVMEAQGLAQLSPSIKEQAKNAISSALIGVSEFQTLECSNISRKQFIDKSLEALGSAKQIRKLLSNMYDVIKVGDGTVADCIVNTLESEDIDSEQKNAVDQTKIDDNRKKIQQALK